MHKKEIILYLLITVVFILAANTDGVFAKQNTIVKIAAGHIKKACEVVWVNTSEYKVDRCVIRTMSALGDENRLRNNELKRLLIESERELEKCQGGRDGVKSKTN